MPSSATKRKRDNFEYAFEACEYLPTASYEGAKAVYEEILNDPHIDPWVMAQVALHDRFFLLAVILNRPDMYNPWLYDRCREVEANTDGYLDLWAREHYKSTIITFAGSIQEMARGSAIYPELFGDRRDYDITIGIFSHTRPIAKAFLNQIKLECELNETLSALYPDVFWQNPKKQAPVWSLDNGLIMQRKSNPKEATVEAWGLVDSQPTGKHFKLIIYDDVVTRESVTTPDMIVKTTESWELSRNLTSKEGDQESGRRTWYIGTRYNFADTYQVMINREAAIPRIYPATDTGTIDGKPIFLTQDDWEQKVKESSTYTIACQQLLNPVAGEEQEFKPQWMRRYEIRPETLNVAICVDPASSKKKGSANSAFAVIGMDANRNKYFLDGAVHKMSLSERWKMLKYLRFKWLKQPGVQVVMVGYEKYGMQADIEHFQEMMKIEKCPFPIEEVSWPQNRQEGAKDDRIRRLIPDHQNWRFFYPELLYNEETREFDFSPPQTKLQTEMILRGKEYLVAKSIKRKNQDGRIYNVLEYFVNNEYLFFPATTLKDMLDSMNRIYDLDFNPPQKVKEEDLLPPYDGDF
jgi:hypothetical protein